MRENGLLAPATSAFAEPTRKVTPMTANNVTITEYASLAYITPGAAIGQLPMEPPLAEQAISVTTSTQSATFNAKTRLIRIANDAGSPVAITIGANPTATVPNSGTGSGRLGINAIEYRAVPANSGFKLAAIQTT
jgi:hypothetical protein